MNLNLNTGERPSRLDLARQLCGELPHGPELAPFQAAMEQAALERERAGQPGVPSFDWEVLSKRAAQVTHEERAETQRDSLASQAQERVPWWKRITFWAPALAACMALFVLLPMLNTPQPHTGLKGSVELSFLVDGPDGFTTGTPGQELHPGDRIQFTYRAPLQQSVVLLGVDGTGESTVYWPESGDLPLPIMMDNGLQLLDGSLQLDTAPGPEVFVAVFGAGTVSEALELVDDAYQAKGHSGVQALDQLPGVDTLRVEKVP